LNHTYSTPDRFVHVCLQVTEQVWQPIHLSRFITIAICAITRIIDVLPALKHKGENSSCGARAPLRWVPVSQGLASR
jgi:hypothetical protein